MVYRLYVEKQAAFAEEASGVVEHEGRGDAAEEPTGVALISAS